MGFVSLVGAGCGDASLLTRRGLDRLQRAGCVLYDHLIDPALLEETPPDCEKICVGKLSGRHTLPQEEINRLLAQKAGEYPLVVRLKGGDPLVFGRGGEEALYLRGAGVPFEIIPGISSAVGGLDCAGIPLTHRGVARGFRVMTASEGGGALPAGLDFESMALTSDTLVFLMGRAKAGALAEALLEAGKPADTPAALVSQAGRPGQAAVFAPLGDFARAVAQADLPDPALIAVGPALALAPQLSFWASGPLAGARLALAQVGEGTTALARRLEDLGAQVTCLPVSRVEPLPGALNGVEFGRYSWLLLSSKNGVDCFFAELERRGLDLRALGGVKIAAIGGEPGRRLAQKGARADLIPPHFDSESLYQTLAPLLGPGDRILFPRVEGGPPELPRRLSAHCPVDTPALYRLTPTPPAPLAQAYRQARPHFTLFTCASGASLLLRALGGAAGLGDSCLLAIGPQTARRLTQEGAPGAALARPYTYEGMAEKVLELWRQRG